jgi:hypothetical protein
MDLFAGIDPGSNGGLGVLDLAGKFVMGVRWKTTKPEALVSTLQFLKGKVALAYIELVKLHREMGVDMLLRMQSLPFYAGVWHGLFLALGVKLHPIAPVAWQHSVGLYKYKSQGKALGQEWGPMDLARSLWPQANLPNPQHDGVAAGLLIAECARQDFLKGLTDGRMQPDKKVRKKRAGNPKMRFSPSLQGR